MRIKSDILNKNFQESLKLQKKTDSEINDERKKYSDEIERNLSNIKDCLTRLREYHESKRKLISKIKNIMETASNHENGLINNKLIKKKQEEYTNEIANLNSLIRTDTSKIEEYRINQERLLIMKNKEKYNINESLSSYCIDEAIEKGRKYIFQISIGYLEDNKRNIKNIDILKRLMAEG